MSVWERLQPYVMCTDRKAAGVWSEHALIYSFIHLAIALERRVRYYGIPEFDQQIMIINGILCRNPKLNLFDEFLKESARESPKVMKGSGDAGPCPCSVCIAPDTPSDSPTSVSLAFFGYYATNINILLRCISTQYFPVHGNKTNRFVTNPRSSFASAI